VGRRVRKAAASAPVKAKPVKTKAKASKKKVTDTGGNSTDVSDDAKVVVSNGEDGSSKVEGGEGNGSENEDEVSSSELESEEGMSEGDVAMS
jgi:hypothetical protein